MEKQIFVMFLVLIFLFPITKATVDTIYPYQNIHVDESSDICQSGGTTLSTSNETSSHKEIYLLFNITPNSTFLPLISQITNATFCIYSKSDYADYYVQNTTASHVYNQSWGCIKWSERPCYYPDNCNDTYESRTDNYFHLVGGYRCFKVINMLNKDYSQGNKNFTILIKGIETTGTQWDFGNYLYSYPPFLTMEYTTPLTKNQIDFSKFNYIQQFGKKLHNHNKCIDNQTLSHNITYLIQIDQNESTINMYVTEPCEYGCDNSTMTCNTNPSNQYVTYAIILLIIGIIILVTIKVIKR
jgi:hypothetical protein